MFFLTDSDFTFTTRHNHNWVSFPLCLSQLILSGAVSNCPQLFPRDSLMAQIIRNPPAVHKTWVQFLVGKKPWRRALATRSGILAWRIPWSEELAGLQSMRTKVRHSWATHTFLCFLFLRFLLLSSPVAHWTPSNIGGSSSSVIFLPFHTFHRVLQARILEWIAISSSSGPRFVRTLHYDPSVLGGPAWHGS